MSTRASPATPRGSEFATEFVEVLAASTAAGGVTVEYSTSSNPCRPEVDPAAVGCVELVGDGAGQPGDGEVAAPRLDRYLRAGRGRSALEFKVKLPHADVNDVACSTPPPTRKRPPA